MPKTTRTQLEISAEFDKADAELKETYYQANEKTGRMYTESLVALGLSVPDNAPKPSPSPREDGA